MVFTLSRGFVVGESPVGDVDRSSNVCRLVTPRTPHLVCNTVSDGTILVCHVLRFGYERRRQYLPLRDPD